MREVEQWRSVAGFEGLYSVSDAGRVRSEARRVRCGLGMRLVPQLILKPKPDKNGYPQVGLSRDDKKHFVRVHVLVAGAFIGPRPDGLQVAHDDGNPSNVAASNLRYDTRKGNMADTIRHGTRRLGECAGMAKLTAEQARAIKSAGPGAIQGLAADFGVSVNHAYLIRAGGKWKHLEEAHA